MLPAELPTVGVRPARFHELGRSHASVLPGGVHPKVVSERLGHSIVSITLDIYSHALPTVEGGRPQRPSEGC